MKMNENLDLKGLTIRIVTLFVKGNCSYESTASYLNIPVSQVEERINDWPTIKKIYRENSSQIIKIIEEKRIEYLTAKLAGEDNMPHLNLASFYHDENKQYIFLRHLALTFHLKLYSLTYLFQIAPDVLYKNLKRYNRSSIESLNYLFGADTSNQELAISTVLDYCEALSDALKGRNQEEMFRLIHQIDDYYPKIIKKKKDENNDIILSLEEIIYILRYQIKYHLSYTQISKTFHISRTIYSKKTRKYVEDKPKLQEQYKSVVDYYDPQRGRK